MPQYLDPVAQNAMPGYYESLVLIWGAMMDVYIRRAIEHLMKRYTVVYDCSYDDTTVFPRRIRLRPLLFTLTERRQLYWLIEGASTCITVPIRSPSYHDWPREPRATLEIERLIPPGPFFQDCYTAEEIDAIGPGIMSRTLIIPVPRRVVSRDCPAHVWTGVSFTECDSQDEIDEISEELTAVVFTGRRPPDVGVSYIGSLAWPLSGGINDTTHHKTTY